MATRRRIGISAATTEAARRQLMAKVPCWERTLVTPDGVPPGSTLKVYKWVKTDKTQQFSDDEDEANEPLAPLPDEPDTADVEGDEDVDQDDTAQPGSVQEVASVASIEQSDTLGVQKENDGEDISKPPSPKPHPLSISFRPSPEPDNEENVFDESLAVGVGEIVGVADDNAGGVGVSVLDMSALGPDGTAFENAHDLSQIQPDDELMGSIMMDQSDDPFAEGLVQ